MDWIKISQYLMEEAGRSYRITVALLNGRSVYTAWKRVVTDEILFGTTRKTIWIPLAYADDSGFAQKACMESEHESPLNSRHTESQS